MNLDGPIDITVGPTNLQRRAVWLQDSLRSLCEPAGRRRIRKASVFSTHLQEIETISRSIPNIETQTGSSPPIRVVDEYSPRGRQSRNRNRGLQFAQ